MASLESQLQTVMKNSTKSSTPTAAPLITNGDDGSEDGDKWGLPLKDLYRLAMLFYKGWRL